MNSRKNIKKLDVVAFTIVILIITLGTLVFPSLAQRPNVESNHVNAQGSPRSPLDVQRTFLIGDSQTVGQFGVAMMNQLTSFGVAYFARAGQSGWGVRNWYLHRHNIARFMRRHHPTLVLVELGGNDFNRSSVPTYNTEVRQFWTYIHEQAERYKPEGTVVSYCWIGPATSVGKSAHLQPGREQAAAIIRQTIGANYFIDSQDITGTYGRDARGLHFTYVGANDWARRIIPRIEDCVRNQLNR